MTAREVSLLLYGFLLGWDAAVLVWLIAWLPRHTPAERAARRAARRVERGEVSDVRD